MTESQSRTPGPGSPGLWFTGSAPALAPLARDTRVCTGSQTAPPFYFKFWDCMRGQRFRCHPGETESVQLRDQLQVLLWKFFKNSKMALGDCGRFSCAGEPYNIICEVTPCIVFSPWHVPSFIFLKPYEEATITESISQMRWLSHSQVQSQLKSFSTQPLILSCPARLHHWALCGTAAQVPWLGEGGIWFGFENKGTVPRPVSLVFVEAVMVAVDSS